MCIHHFQNLLRQPPIVDGQPIEKVFELLFTDQCDFTPDKRERAIKLRQTLQPLTWLGC